jgi:hypothetical protein
MESNKIESFVEFVNRSDNMDLFAETVIYRGQSVRGNLLPGIARENPEFDTTEEEKRSLLEMKYLGASLLPREETDLDLLVRAQHYGLKTRLLDWTSNALAALWFACASTGKGDVYVYSLEADGLFSEPSEYNASPFGAKLTRVLRPRFNNPNIVAQNGWFTLHKYSAKAKRFIPLENNADTRPKLTEFLIPKKARPAILQSLDRHGVSARTLIPDLYGLCRYLNWQHESRVRSVT